MLNPLRIIIIIILVVTNCTISNAQNLKEGAFAFSRFKKKYIQLPDIDEKKLLNKPVGRFVVYDTRFDTSAVGFVGTSMLLFKNTCAELGKYLNDVQGGAITDQLPTIALFIKRLWQTRQWRYSTHTFINKRERRDSIWQAGLMMKIECYIVENNVFTPIMRYDTVFGYISPVPELKLITDTFAVGLRSLLQEVGHAIEKTTRRNTKKYSFDELLQYYAKQKNWAILTDTTLHRGVYRSYNDFRNNRPVYSNFETGKGKLSDMLYVKDSTGAEYPVNKIWGYCNGETVFIRSTANFFALARQQNSFYCIGIKSLSRKIYITPGDFFAAGLGVANNQNNNMRIQYGKDFLAYQLDMETGELY